MTAAAATTQKKAPAGLSNKAREMMEAINAEAFGPGRFARSAYRVREGTPPVASLSLAGWRNGKLVGGIRFTAIGIGARENALLLGPLVVAPSEKGSGYGRALVEAGIARAREEAFDLVLLVGDMPYYGRFGFVPVTSRCVRPVGHVPCARAAARRACARQR